MESICYIYKRVRVSVEIFSYDDSRVLNKLLVNTVPGYIRYILKGVSIKNNWFGKNSKKSNPIVDNLLNHITKARIIKNERTHNMELIIDFEDIDITSILNEFLTDEKLISSINDPIILSLFNSLNKKSSNKEKMELLEFLVDWISRNDLLQEIINSLAEKNETLKRLNLKVGGITIKSEKAV